MFTGIIADVGRLRRIVPGVDTRLEIETTFDPDGIAMGASIACSGICLTVIAKDRDSGQSWFAVQASQETLARTSLGRWRANQRINLERALKAGDELGGHIVSGHVDGVGEVISRTAVGGDTGGSVEFVIGAPPDLMPLIAAKGSIALDGVSLTVNRVERDRFSVNLIPHSLRETTFGQVQAGDPLNIEIDMLARYVARILGKA
jgi:riboflavin synthase